MNTQNTIIAIEKQVKALNAKINNRVTAIMADPLTVVANTVTLIELQREFKQINILNHFVLVLQEEPERADRQIKMLLEMILENRIMNSTCLASNTVENYRYEGMRDAYSFLVETLKEAK